MVDENKTFFVTEHVHFDEETGQMMLCEPIKALAQPIFARGFKRGEVFFKLDGYGHPDFSDAMHVFFKDLEHPYQVG